MSTQPELFGEKAIEVATMLGDSVVDVKHCMDPHGGKVTPRTWGMLATGGVCLLISAIAFYVSVRTAAYNQAAYDYWTHVAHKPGGAFRGQLMSGGYDWVAFGGLAMGLVTIVVGLFRMRREKQDPFYRIGTAPGVQAAVEGAPAPSFALVAPKGDDFVFNYGVGMTGDMIVGDKSVPLAELAASGHARPSTSAPGAFELPIPAAGRIRANIGMTQFLVKAVAKPQMQSSPMMAGLESRTMAYFAGSLAAHLGIVMLLALVPADDGTASFDLAVIEDTTLHSNTVEKTDIAQQQEEVPDVGGAGAEASAKSMELEEGAAGTTKSNNIDGHIRIKNNNVDPQIARAEALEAAREAGILGSEALRDGDFFSRIGEVGNVSSGNDADNVWGPIYGAEGEGAGTFGYGRHGFGPGGGCPVGENCGIIGTPDGYGNLIGTGKYGQMGWDGLGGGRPGLHKHVAQVPGPIIGQPESTGDLDRAIIRRYINRNKAKIGYCYEKQLLAHPDIAGTVQIGFFITPNGNVGSSSGKGFDAEVASCVADVVKNIEFPKPNGGGGVQVNYPITFHAAG